MSWRGSVGTVADPTFEKQISEDKGQKTDYREQMSEFEIRNAESRQILRGSEKNNAFIKRGSGFQPRSGIQ